MDQWKEVKKSVGGPKEVMAEHDQLIAWRELGYGMRSKEKPIPFDFQVELDGVEEPISIKGAIYGLARVSGGVILFDKGVAPVWVQNVDAIRDVEAEAYRMAHRYGEAQAVEQVYNQLIDLIITEGVK